MSWCSYMFFFYLHSSLFSRNITVLAVMQFADWHKFVISSYKEPLLGHCLLLVYAQIWPCPLLNCTYTVFAPIASCLHILTKKSKLLLNVSTCLTKRTASHSTKPQSWSCVTFVEEKRWTYWELRFTATFITCVIPSLLVSFSTNKSERLQAFSLLGASENLI
jgi:hypothetical protein